MRIFLTAVPSPVKDAACTLLILQGSRALPAQRNASAKLWRLREAE
ncbi:hypothetical protein [Nostoc sp.]